MGFSQLVLNAVLNFANLFQNLRTLSLVRGRDWIEGRLLEKFEKKHILRQSYAKSEDWAILINIG